MELIYDKTCPDAMYRKDHVIKDEGPHALIIGIKIEKMYDIDNNPLLIAHHPKEIIKIPISKKVEKWDLLRIRK